MSHGTSIRCCTRGGGCSKRSWCRACCSSSVKVKRVIRDYPLQLKKSAEGTLRACAKRFLECAVETPGSQALPGNPLFGRLCLPNLGAAEPCWTRGRASQQSVPRQSLGTRVFQGSKRLFAQALRQLQNLTGAEMAFAHVVQHLLALSFQALDWNDGPFEVSYPYRCSEESNVTLQKFSGSRDFTCADGIKRLFSWHSKINAVAWRIHFLPNPQSRRVLIGYVGVHLPTVGDPH